MVKRDSRLGFLGGAHVFPGGAVDDADSDPRLDGLCEGMTAEQAAEALAIKDVDRARGYTFAAIRELFEEAGILLARGTSGEWVDLDEDTEDSHRLLGLRAPLAKGELSLADLAEQESLRLNTGALHYFAHWITPERESKRFDTRFFLAEIPHCQSADHDRHETTEGEWLTPAAALKRYAARDIELVPPTICSLDRLAVDSSVEEALQAARELDVVEVLPKISINDGDVTILYSGDDDYQSGVARRASSGMLLNRLVLRDGLWERP